MVITYYADVIFTWNYLMNFLIILLIHPDAKHGTGRIAVAAGAGAVFTLGVLYLWKGNLLIFFILRFLSAIALCLIAMPNKGFGELICNAVLLYGVSGCVFGAYSIVAVYFNGERKRVNPAIILVSLGILFAGKMLLRFRKIRNKQMVYTFAVTLKNNNRVIHEKAFYDSGNHLYEPISGKPVVLIPKHIGRLLDLCNSTLRAIPYSSLGNEYGMLNAYRLDELIIHKEAKELHYKEVYAAIAADEMFRQESCGMILHSEQI